MAGAAAETARTCGSCGLCCKVLRIDVLEKEAHSWCEHYAPATGCGIYNKRPQVCRGYQCRWLYDPSLGEEWKPERCGFVVAPGKSGVGLWINTDLATPLAWRREPFYSQIRQWSEVSRHGGGYVAVAQGDRVFVVFPEEEVEVDGVVPDSALKVGYRVGPAGRRPLVFVRSPKGRVQEFAGRLHR